MAKATNLNQDHKSISNGHCDELHEFILNMQQSGWATSSAWTRKMQKFTHQSYITASGITQDGTALPALHGRRLRLLQSSSTRQATLPARFSHTCRLGAGQRCVSLSICTLEVGLASLNQPTAHGPLAVGHVEDAWDVALAACIAAQRSQGAHSTYASCFKVGPAEREVEEGFPPGMPYYLRHTSRFNNHTHARSLRLRCCSIPFAACPTLHT